jgi:hypothetical protein
MGYCADLNNRSAETISSGLQLRSVRPSDANWVAPFVGQIRRCGLLRQSIPHTCFADTFLTIETVETHFLLFLKDCLSKFRKTGWLWWNAVTRTEHLGAREGF